MFLEVGVLSKLPHAEDLGHFCWVLHCHSKAHKLSRRLLLLFLWEASTNFTFTHVRRGGHMATEEASGWTGALNSQVLVCHTCDKLFLPQDILSAHHTSAF
jgi:hypothetical protein